MHPKESNYNKINMPKFKSFVYDAFAIFRPEIIDGLCYVKFGLAPIYKARLAPFGFDWVRTGDNQENIAYDLPYKENIGRYFIDSEKTKPSVCGGEQMFFCNQPGMYAKLCKSYLPGNLKYFPSENGKIKSYQVPVLSVYPYSHSHPEIPYLSLMITIKREITQIQFDYDKTLFKIEGIDTLPTEIGNYETCISVKCINELEQDEYIRVTSINRRGKVRNAGILRICKNARHFRRRMDILLVNIKCMSSEDSSAMVLNGDTEAAKINIKCAFRHALITVNIEEVELDLGYDLEISARLMNFNGELYIISAITITDSDGRKFVDNSFPELSIILSKKLKAMNLDISKYDSIVFCLGMRIASKNEKSEYRLLNGYNTDKYVILCGGHTGITAVHELLHTLNLNHTFDNFHGDNTVNAYTYKIYATDNILDYTHYKNVERINLWEWQWQKMRKVCVPENNI